MPYSTQQDSSGTSFICPNCCYLSLFSRWSSFIVLFERPGCRVARSYFHSLCSCESRGERKRANFDRLTNNNIHRIIRHQPITPKELKNSKIADTLLSTKQPNTDNAGRHCCQHYRICYMMPQCLGSNGYTQTCQHNPNIYKHSFDWCQIGKRT